ncbi:MAG: urease accessory protein UreD [Xanthobacteraceae bacterium]|nr:urease accessory protein UreD [Xanthobacteraceae bacterium]
MRSLPLSCSVPEAGREVEARLAFDVAGGRTTLRRQHVGYPLHITRGFYLDKARPDLLTLYLQSASGGVYADDRLGLDVAVDANAAVNITTQASTVVHDGRGTGAIQRLTVTVGAGAFCAIVNDPYIMFPGARLSLGATASVAEDGVLILADGFAVHDPRERDRAFARYSASTRILRPDGRLLVSDHGSVDGDEMAMRSGALGGMNAAATVFIVARPDRLPGPEEFENAADRCGCLAGASVAPNQAGMVMRLLAPDGGALGRGIEAAFHVAACSTLGVDLARRRK